MTPISRRAWELYRLLRETNKASVGTVARADLKETIRHYFKEEAEKAGVSYLQLLNECDRINKGG